MSKPRLSYVTHVDWGHVRQRPHHIATCLATDFDVTVVSPISRQRSMLVDNPDEGLRRLGLWRAPGSYRSAALFALNNTLCAAQLRWRMPSHLDAIVVTAPECMAWVAPSLRTAKLAYDCMDDALAFDQDEGVRIAKAHLETLLLARADAVFASSGMLAERCVARGAVEAKVHVVHNGWDPQVFPVLPTRPLHGNGPLILAYFGTLDRWLDFAALEAAVQAVPQLTIRLIGPNACAYSPSHPRIVLCPPVPHAALAVAVADVDGFVLPFKVTDLVRAVDPVKLYEYIALGRPVLSAYWPGLERFRECVTFYADVPQFAAMIAGRALAPPPAAETRARFLAQQTWAARAAAMVDALTAPAAQSVPALH